MNVLVVCVERAQDLAWDMGVQIYIIWHGIRGFRFTFSGMGFGGSGLQCQPETPYP